MINSMRDKDAGVISTYFHLSKSVNLQGKIMHMLKRRGPKDIALRNPMFLQSPN
jgi:hypothetical protein